MEKPKQKNVVKKKVDPKLELRNKNSKRNARYKAKVSLSHQHRSVTKELTQEIKKQEKGN